MNDAPTHIIIVSFILGFFSRRTYKLLKVIGDRIIKPLAGERAEDNK